MGRIESMVQHAVDIAENDYHGYSWADRWNRDRDCSSLAYDSADAAGYPVGRGPDRTRYTGTMIDDFTAAGFKLHDYDSFEEYRGCILLRDPWGENGHTEIYIGDGLTVGAHSAENGGVYGEPGDQTGNEISIAPNPEWWDYILEPPADEVALEWPLIVWPSHGGENQKFTLEFRDGYCLIYCKANGKAIDVHGSDLNGDVNLYPAHGGDNQLWKLVKVDDMGMYEIESKLNSDYVLDVVGNSADEGSELCLWKRHGGVNQRWHLMANGDGTFTIVSNVNRKLVLDAANGGK